MNTNAALGLLVLAVLTACAFCSITVLDALGRHVDLELIDAARGLLAATLLYVGGAHLAASRVNGNGPK